MAIKAMAGKEVLRSHPSGQEALHPRQPVGSLRGGGEAHFGGSLGFIQAARWAQTPNNQLRAGELKRAVRDHPGVPRHRQWGFGEGHRKPEESRSQQQGVSSSHEHSLLCSHRLGRLVTEARI